jgi:hypothetical protein
MSLIGCIVELKRYLNVRHAISHETFTLFVTASIDVSVLVERW